jgi:hypothetical protein
MEGMEKYVAAALEGYEQNLVGVTDAIQKMEQQLETYRGHEKEMREGIVEMKQLLGLEEETVETAEASLKLVQDEEAEE